MSNSDHRDMRAEDHDKNGEHSTVSSSKKRQKFTLHFARDQKELLKAAFLDTPYPNPQEKELLAKVLETETQNISVWMNWRRAENRKRTTENTRMNGNDAGGNELQVVADGEGACSTGISKKRGHFSHSTPPGQGILSLVLRYLSSRPPLLPSLEEIRENVQQQLQEIDGLTASRDSSTVPPPSTETRQKKKKNLVLPPLQKALLSAVFQVLPYPNYNERELLSRVLGTEHIVQWMGWKRFDLKGRKKNTAKEVEIRNTPEEAAIEAVPSNGDVQQKKYLSELPYRSPDLEEIYQNVQEELKIIQEAEPSSSAVPSAPSKRPPIGCKNLGNGWLQMSTHFMEEIIWDELRAPLSSTSSETASGGKHKNGKAQIPSSVMEPTAGNKLNAPRKCKRQTRFSEGKNVEKSAFGFPSTTGRLANQKSWLKPTSRDQPVHSQRKRAFHKTASAASIAQTNNSAFCNNVGAFNEMPAFNQEASFAPSMPAINSLGHSMDPHCSSLNYNNVGAVNEVSSFTQEASFPPPMPAFYSSEYCQDSALSSSSTYGQNLPSYALRTLQSDYPGFNYTNQHPTTYDGSSGNYGQFPLDVQMNLPDYPAFNNTNQAQRNYDGSYTYDNGSSYVPASQWDLPDDQPPMLSNDGYSTNFQNMHPPQTTPDAPPPSSNWFTGDTLPFTF